MTEWFKKSTEEVAEHFEVTILDGLSTDDARERLRHDGENRFSEGHRTSTLQLLLRQFKDVLIIILLISATISLALSFLGEGKDAGEAILIYVIVFGIAAIGFFNELKAEKTVASLTKLVSFKARVRRDGHVSEVDSTQLVVGDIVELEEGQKVPADIRLISVKNLTVNEASITGESLPVSKRTFALRQSTALADQKNMAFAGTFVASGKGEGIVVATGESTELGKIAALMRNVSAEPTPLQRKLDDLGKKLGVIISVICAVVFVVVFFLVDQEKSASISSQLIFAFTAAVALAVAAIPEGLAFVVRISLALGARRMAQKHALVRKLSAVEALGSTDVICTDKTGTLTKGQMTVRELYVIGQRSKVSGEGYDFAGQIEHENGKASTAIDRLVQAGVLCNNAHIKEGSVIGDPTEAALQVLAHKHHIEPTVLQADLPKVEEFPFSSERKRMTTVHKRSLGEYLVVQKGAVEAVLKDCTHYLDASGKRHALSENVRTEILAVNAEMAGRALRVLGFADKTVDEIPKREHDAECELTFVGLQAMIDPPRKEVVDVIHRVRVESGIRVVMITGDNIDTARAIGKEIGLSGEAVTGLELDAMSPSEFEARVESISVYARVNPEHKIRIVQALKKHGHQVAMTGDGVNDAAAIKAADIGIAMGVTGTDAAKEAADLILLDDQFLTIISAIEEGRGIYDNVRKFVNFLLSTNVAEMLAVLVGIIVFQNLILTAAQILFTNILTDGIPAVALGSDPAEKGVLRFKPQRFQQAIITNRMWLEMAVFSVLMTVLVLGLYHYAYTYEGGAVAAMSAVFVGMVVFEKARLYEIRSHYRIKWYQNPWLSVTVFATIATQVILLYVPWFADFMKVQPLTAVDWVIMLSGALFLFVSMKLLRPVFQKIAP